MHFALSDSNMNLIDDHFDVAVRMGRLQDSPRSRKLWDCSESWSLPRAMSKSMGNR
jgi:hypothetical protein